MNWKGCGRKRSWPNLRYYPGICLEGLGKPRKTSVMIASLRDLNLGPPEYEAGVLTTELGRNEENEMDGAYSTKRSK
jgi:hypothetical protein